MNDSSMPGRTTSGPELTNVSAHGIWLLYEGRELYLPFRDFPWFMDASIRQLAAVSEPRPGHLRWAQLDVDLPIGAIDNPGAYPMVARAAAAVRERKHAGDTAAGSP